MSERVFNVLFLCTGNSARSIMAESILSKEGAGHFKAFSAGSQPKADVNPLAIETLQKMGYPSTGFRSKSWDEFDAADAPKMDFIITVCDNAAGETCPIWPGHPIRVHWGIEDPAAAEGTHWEQLTAFATAFRYLKNRISALISLPVEKLEASLLADKMRDIGRSEGATERAS
jgi:arsenate reductase